MHLSALYRFPLKSAIGEALSVSPVGILGLQGDRRWLAVDASNGRFLTQRLLPQMTQLLARYAADDALTLSAPALGEIQVAVPGADAELRGVTVWSLSLIHI